MKLARNKKLIFVIALVILIIIGTVFYVKRQIKGISSETCPTVDLETECFSEKCFAEIECFDEVPSDDVWDKDMWDK